MTFTDWILDQILRSGFSRKEIAKRANIPKGKFDSICKGEFPQKHLINDIAYALSLETYEVIDAMEGREESTFEPVKDHFGTSQDNSVEKIEKPGEKQKTSKIKNSSSRVHDIKKPDDKECWICNQPDDGTCYFHHMEVPYYKIKYGSGTSVKVIDKLTVWGHHSCGTELSIQPLKSDPEINHLRYEVQWSRLIIENKII